MTGITQNSTPDLPILTVDDIVVTFGESLVISDDDDDVVPQLAVPNFDDDGLQFANIRDDPQFEDIKSHEEGIPFDDLLDMIYLEDQSPDSDDEEELSVVTGRCES